MKGLTAKDVMSRPVVTVAPLMEIGAAARLLSERSITGAPVVDDKGRLVGVLSATDVTRFLGHPPIDGWDKESGAPRESAPVVAVMTPKPITCHEDTPVDVVAELMLVKRIHRVVVVTAEGGVCGIVSSMDLLRALPSASRALRDPLHCRWT